MNTIIKLLKIKYPDVYKNIVLELDEHKKLQKRISSAKYRLKKKYNISNYSKTK